MEKWFGKIGYTETKEDEEEPGIWREEITERSYFGSIYRSYARIEKDNAINRDVKFSTSISIVSDPFAIDNFCNIRYVTALNKKWEVSNVEIQYPRLILTIGGLYNERQT